jgi:ubiquinone/menaquinone biosynthesis C-methylase UbiE
VIGWLYDLLARRAERAGIGQLRHDLLAGLEGEVIEIGSGTGASLPYYERATRVVAVEPDPSMAKRLPAKVEEAKVPVEVVSARAQALPFPDESFDVAVAAFVLCSVEDQGEVLVEARRLLRPGGKLVLLEHVLGEGGTARWQNRLTPLHKRMAGNCHLNRDTRAAVARAGFDVAGIQPTLLPGTHALVRPGIQGVAIKTSS